jgi:aminoglycoside phosphotransferase (APT) family kinase protein
MATIGHPLSDLANLFNPHVLARNRFQPPRDHSTFVPGNTPGLPTEEQCLAWYSEVAGWNPSPDIAWGEAFAILRNCVIMQGIAARYALRQASSAKAQTYGELMEPYGELAWSLVEKVKESSRAKAKL